MNPLTEKRIKDAKLKLEWEESGREFAIEGSSCGESWQIISDPKWNDEWNYRRRPEPRLRPWTLEEARGKWVKEDRGFNTYQITGVSSTHAFVGGSWISFPNLLSGFTQHNGSACGEVE